MHELYFEKLMKLIKESFDSGNNFIQDIKSSAIGTPGWVLLTFNKKDCKLHTYILYKHHIGLPMTQEIIFALDCLED